MSLLNSHRDTLKVIFLSVARMNGTIILRVFGQLPGAHITNEDLTYFYLKPGYKAWNYFNAEHTQKVHDLIFKAKAHPGPFFAHEMTGDISEIELKMLRTEGFRIVLVLRDPRRVAASLMKLPPNDPKFREDLMAIGFGNMKHYWEHGLIDMVLDSQRFLAEEVYRQTIFSWLGLTYRSEYVTQMVRFRGEEFHEICAITKSWKDRVKNPWNGPSGSAMSLHSDESKPIEDTLVEPWMQDQLPAMVTLYQSIIAHA